MATTENRPLNDDEKLLAKLGYKQDLNRSWSGFSNFAISFSIISILAGCLTNFGVGLNNGGPVSISWTWPILSAFILLIGFTMSELVSAYPTSGGIYWWASKLGGPMAGFFTGWLNLIGLVAVTAGVSYGAATFVEFTMNTYFDYEYNLTRTFFIFLGILAMASLLNISRGHLMALMNNVSVWWHVIGASILVLVLVFVPDNHQSVSYVFTERFNNSGYFEGSTSSFGFWMLVIPFGFLLTQYTITGFDACAHLSEETSSASTGAAKGIWQSIFYSAIGGYILLLACVFAIPNDADGNPDTLGVGGAISPIQYLFVNAMNSNWASLLLLISAVGQLFCATSCMTSASRMLFAFSRDRAVPGSKHWSSLTSTRVPARAVGLVATVAALITLPALVEVNLGTAEAPFIIPVAFYAVTSVAVLGLYLSFSVPIYLRWRHGDKFEVGPWNNGAKYKWMNPIAVAEILIVSVALMLPSLALGNPFNDDFAWKFVNYSPIILLGSLLLLTIWWNVSAKNWFTGPVHTIDEEVVKVFDEG